MANSHKGLSAKDIQRRLKQGRGQGHGSAYKPFITVRDISSKGRSHRIYGAKSRRIHHLLSDLELSIFLSLDWRPLVTDVREQFPLSVDDTYRIANEAGIKHPNIQDTLQVMTTDFVVDLANPDIPTVALSAKYAADLDDERTIEKLEIERRAFSEKKIPWHLITELEIDKSTLKNIQWLYPAQSNELDQQELNHYYDLFSQKFRKDSNKKIVLVTQQMDADYSLDNGESLFWLRQLLARRYLTFDIRTPYLQLKGEDLFVNDRDELMELYRAAD